jgi:outer membrane protein assembly factor BamB
VESLGFSLNTYLVLLFTIAKIWNKPRELSEDGWIQKHGVYTMEYFPAIKNETLSFLGK